MNQSFYVGSLGAFYQQKALNVQGNNIANVNTHGYKTSVGRFSSLMHTKLKGIDDAELPIGTGTILDTTTVNHRQGPAATTNRTHDYMIEGSGFFGLVDMETEEVSFTRNGAFQLSEFPGGEGEESVFYLTDSGGRVVLDGNGVPLKVKDPNEAQPVGVFDYRNYDGMQTVSGTRFLPIEKNGDLWQGSGRVINGALEMSNVELTEEITKVIEAQRAYSMSLKMVQTSDEIEATINGLRG